MDRTEINLMEQRTMEYLFGACVITAPDATLQSCAWLKPADIRDPRIKRLWENANDGYRSNGMGAALEAGLSHSDISTMVMHCPSVYDAEAYAREAQRRAYLAGLDQHLVELHKARQNNDVEAFREAISRLHTEAPTVGDSIPTVDQIAAEFLAALDTHGITISTGIPTLDRATGGLERRLEYVLAARPSMGKSTLAFQIARNVALRGHKALIFSLEMTRMQLWAKAACGSVEVSWKDVRDGNAGRDVIEQVKTASSQMIDAYADRLLIDDRVHHTTETVWQDVARYKPDLVVVDVMARLKNKGDSEVRRLGEIVYGLREMAKENNCALLTLHHVSRNAESRQDNRPTMADLRDSGEIEQAADSVWFLWSKEYYDTSKPLPREIPTEVMIAKNRDGQRNAVVRLKYDSLAQWFEPA